MFNVLREQALRDHEDDEVLKVIPAINEGPTIGSGEIDYLTLRVSIRQLMDAF